MHNKHPKLVRDAYWDDPEPSLPYTKSCVSLKLNSQPDLGSTIHLDVEPEQFLPMQTIMEEDREDYAYTLPPNTTDVQNSFTYTQAFGAGRTAHAGPPLSTSNSFMTAADVLNNNHINGALLNGCAVGVESIDEPCATASQSNSRGALRKLQERGSRLLHMLSAGSHENVSRIPSNSTVNLAGLEVPRSNSRLAQLSSFLLRTPRKRSRTDYGTVHRMIGNTAVAATLGPCHDSNAQVNALRPPYRQHSTGPMLSVNNCTTSARSACQIMNIRSVSNPSNSRTVTQQFYP
jgi:hypothetical protein